MYVQYVCMYVCMRVYVYVIQQVLISSDSAILTRSACGEVSSWKLLRHVALNPVVVL